ncbi:MAG: hypothetical protein RLZZ307_35, partial [Actinomycetota bacterium]
MDRMVCSETALMEAYYMSAALNSNQWNAVYSVFSFG